MNPLIPVSIAINGLLLGVVAFNGEYPQWLILILAAFVALSVVGAILIAGGMRKPGAIIVAIGCLVFSPIGLIGVIGASKMLHAPAVTPKA